MIKLRNLFCFILTIVCFWYQISGIRNPATGTRNWYQILVPVFWYQFLVRVPETGTRYWYQFLVPVSGQYVMGIRQHNKPHVGWMTTFKRIGQYNSSPGNRAYC